ncbi:hypothetical protein KO465_09575 [Candidatus Micrarchaeota archaeon]|nr:hypothetical protein [Candidatus Micrarchaeota archaeon]
MENSITDLKFRHIRYIKSNGNFAKVPKKFYNYRDLIQYLEKKRYKDAYYSISKWLNPQNISAKSKEREYRTIFLGMDLFFDIDFSEYEFNKNIELAKNETLKILEYGKKEKWNLKYIAFSGSKGFHIAYGDLIKNYPAHPQKREEYAKKFYTNIVEKVSEKINIDKAITKDTRRIVRIPGTYNSKTGYMCTIIEPSDLEKSTDMFLKTIPYDKNRGPSPLIKRMMTELRIGADNLGKLWLPLSCNHSSKYIQTISSTVSRVNKHVLILDYSTYFNLYQVKKYLNEMKIPYVVLENEDSIQIFSPMAFEKQEMEKILKITKSRNYNAMKKYKHVLLKISGLNKDFKPLEASIKDIHIPDEKIKRPLSSAHYELFKSITGKKEFEGCEKISSELIFRMMEIN